VGGMDSLVVTRKGRHGFADDKMVGLYLAPGHKMPWKRDRLLWRLAGISAVGQPSREPSPISNWKVAWGHPHQQEEEQEWHADLWKLPSLNREGVCDGREDMLRTGTGRIEEASGAHAEKVGAPQAGGRRTSGPRAWSASGRHRPRATVR
jgi:hypothetical protein